MKSLFYYVSFVKTGYIVCLYLYNVQIFLITFTSPETFQLNDYNSSFSCFYCLYLLFFYFLFKSRRSKKYSPQLYSLTFPLWVTRQITLSPAWGVKGALLVRWKCQSCLKDRSVCVEGCSSLLFSSSSIVISGGWKLFTWQMNWFGLPNSPGSRLYTMTFGGAEKHNDKMKINGRAGKMWQRQ